MIELLVALAIGGILLSLALPSFKTFLGNNEIATTTNDFVYSLQTARSEAIKRSQNSGLCASSSPLAAAASCDVGAAYTDGWIVYVDDNNNSLRDLAEDVIHRAEPRSGAFAFTPDAVFALQVYFDASGNSVNGAGIPLSGQINVDFAGGSEVRNINVSANGRIFTDAP